MSTPLRVLVVHPGAGFSTHDVFMGVQEAMRGAGVTVASYPLDVKLAASSQFLQAQRLMEIGRWKTTRRPIADLDVQLQACEGLVVRAKLQKIDVIYVVSGMFVPLAVLQVLKLFGVPVLLHLTESPYDAVQEAQWAGVVSGVFTNERSIVPTLEAVNPNVRYMRHAWRAGMHNQPLKRMTAVERKTMPAAVPDVLFVGSGFPSRVAWLRTFRTVLGQRSRHKARLDLYGQWEIPAKVALRESVRGGVTDNLVAAALYHRAQVGLNIYRQQAGWSGEQIVGDSINPRAVELAAAGCVHVSTSRQEVGEMFGDLVPQCDTPESAVDAVLELRAESTRRRLERRAALRAAVAHDTWDDRMAEVVPLLEKLR